jgi:tRNA(Ile)-lysidine synthase
MDEKFLIIIKEKLKISASTPIVVGFSGGIDSVCLASLFSGTSIPIIIAHFNHSLRETANRDEEFSRDFAEKRNIPFYSEKGDVHQYAKDQHLSVEESARKLRYEFLFRIARKNNAGNVAVAHHADDQVETVLMHLFRGSGMAGLLGMQFETIIPEFSEDIKLIRPLLNFWRSEIEDYCIEQKLEFVQDETNFLETYERNRIRNTIFPFLNKYYPGLKSRILKTTTILEDEDQIIESLLLENWSKVCSQHHAEFVKFKRNEFNDCWVALKRRLVRKAIFALNPKLRNLSFENVENVIHFSQSEKTGEIDLVENFIAVFSEKEILFGERSKKWIGILYPQLENEIPFNCNTDQIIQLSNHWQLEIKKINMSENLNLYSEDRFSVYLDADKFVNDQLILRHRKVGDRFQPLGMKDGTIKISDFFINEKLMKPARDQWPILVNIQNEIIWVPGYRPNHSVCVTDTSENLIKFSIKKID